MASAPRLTTALAAVSLAGLTALAGCSHGSDATFSSDPAAADAAGGAEAASSEPMPLSLLVFNVEYGGTRASDAVIEDVDADVVGVLESYNRLPTIAKHAGYPYYDVGLQIMSKYPILEPSGADGLYAFLEVRPGEAVAMVNTHLDYVQDGPNRLARGVPVEDVLATEREVRLASIEKLLPSASTLLDAGWPVLLTGDLNEPSHLDGDIAWPVSEAVTGAGFTDSYRETHPDPVADPGYTWGGVAGSGGSPRRIDYAYVGGPVEVETSEVVGERGAPGVDRGYPGWTSDHRAVFSRLQVTPSSLPTTIALSSRMLTVGDSVTATYVMPDGADGGSVTLDGPSTQTTDVDGTRGSAELRTGALAPGDYAVELTDTAGRVLATNALHLRPRQAEVRLTTDAAAYDVGDPVTVRWADGPANRWDWIGVYRADAADPAKDDYLVWGYTGGHDAGALPPTADGELVLGREHQGRPWPLPPGTYVAHYLLTDQYVSAGSTTFRVRG